MGSRDNLIWIKPGKRARELGRKGGLANKNNPNTIRAAKLRWLREKQFSCKDAKWFVKLIEDPAMSDIELVDIYNKFKKSCKEDQLQALFQAAIQLKKAIHGDNSNQTNIQVNVFNEAETKKSIKRLLDEDNTITVSNDSEE